MLKKFDCYDGLCFFEGLCFFAPVALLVRTRAGVSHGLFLILQALISLTILLGEIPTGMLADRMGYKRTIALSQLTLLLARILLLMGFLLCSPAIFVAEALVEGIAICFSSGTTSAYLYEVYGKDQYLAKSAQSSNYGTAGFILSTVAYLFLYKFFGIPGLLIATVLADTIAAGFALCLKKEELRTAKLDAFPSFSRLLCILRQKTAIAMMALASVFSVAGILINFFYVEKLLSCGVSAQYMSPIILVYSGLTMLAKPILDALNKVPKGRLMGISCILAAAAMILFAQAKTAAPIISLMLLLPLLLDIPAFCLGERENAFIDHFDRGENRAANLSVMNMGVSLVEILALFASALLTAAGVGLCFLAVGLALLAFGLWFNLQ